MKKRLRELFDRLYKMRYKAFKWAAALAGTYGCLYLLGLAGVQQSLFSALCLPILAAVYLLAGRTAEDLVQIEDRKQRRRRICFGETVAYLFSLAMILGYQLQNTGITDYGVRGKGLILIRAFLLSMAFFPFGNLLFAGVEWLGQRAVPEGKKLWKTGAVMGISAALIFVCLIPVWLAYYPLVMSYDFHRQINEAVKGFIWFIPYQPLAHTWVIWCFLQLGYLLGDAEAGFGCMALFQMALYALVTGYSSAFVYRVTKRKWTVAAAVLFFGVLPANSVMVMCSTKDVIFSTLFLLFHLLMAERFFFCSGKKKIAVEVCLTVTGCLMMQFRNNCIYAIAVYSVFWILFTVGRERLRVLLLCVLLLAGGKGMSIAVKEAIGTEISDGMQKVEKYSVPAMQFARVGHMYGETLPPELHKLLDHYLPEEAWPGYLPYIADGMKSSIRMMDAWEGHLPQLIKDWARIGAEYPNEYIDAFLELTRGYWFPDDRSYAECLGWGPEGRMGLIYTYISSEIMDPEEGGLQEVRHISKFPWLETQLEKVVSENAFYRWPIISLLFKASFYFWALWLLFAACIYLRRRKHALLYLSPVLYMATMLLGPVVWLRYVFPVMMLLPMLLGGLCIKEPAENSDLRIGQKLRKGEK